MKTVFDNAGFCEALQNCHITKTDEFIRNSGSTLFAVVVNSANAVARLDHKNWVHNSVSWLPAGESYAMTEWIESFHPADNFVVVYSYDTPIAIQNIRTRDYYVTSEKYSPTTTRHTNSVTMGLHYAKRTA